MYQKKWLRLYNPIQMLLIGLYGERNKMLHSFITKN